MRYRLHGLDCPECAAKLEQELQRIEGLEKAVIHFHNLTLEIPEDSVDTARKALARLEPDVTLESLTMKPSSKEAVTAAEQRRRYLIGVAGVLFIIGLVFNPVLHQTAGSWAEYLVLLTAYFLVGWPVIRSAARRIGRREWLDENFLMTLATIGAIALHQLAEAAGVMLFYAVGEYFEARAVNRSRRSIAALVSQQPEYANLKVGDEMRQVAPAEVTPGTLVWIKPGEKVPLDGKVVEGRSYLDTAALTGETTPRKVEPGETVLAGMLNGQGFLVVEVERPYAQSAMARIIALVEQASERKAPTEQFITRFARFYTPAVVGGSVLIALLPPLLLPGASFGEWLHRALVLLVISCPCALMISIPLGYFGGIGGASRNGILVKGANFLEALTRIDTIVFDKTGTLTQGVFQVTALVPRNGFSEDELLAATARAELLSNHPIAESIRRAWEARGGAKNATETIVDYQEIPAYGISAKVGGMQVLAGNARLLGREGIAVEAGKALAGTIVYVALDGVYAGYISIADALKADAATAIQELRRLGVRKMVMLTGDTADVAKSVADSLGFDGYYADLLPEDKVARLEELEGALTDRHRQKLIFVGDGMNDAPVLSRADVGIAMGGLGSAAAIEAADVVLMDDALEKLAAAVKIARRTRRIVWQNIILALGVKGVFITMGICGVANIWEAVFADVGVTLLAVLNASRTLQLKR